MLRLSAANLLVTSLLVSSTVRQGEVCGCPPHGDLIDGDLNLTFACFACAGVTEKDDDGPIPLTSHYPERVPNVKPTFLEKALASVEAREGHLDAGTHVG